MQNAQPLGVAQGQIRVDLQQMEQAAARVVQLSQQMTVAMAGIGRGGTQGMLQAMQQTMRMQQTLLAQTLKASQQSAQTTLNAIQTTTNLVVQNVQTAAQNATKAVQQLQQANAKANASTPQAPRSPMSGMGGGGMMPMPTFIQFSTWSAAGLAQSVGAQGLASGLMGAGNLLGVADMMSIVGSQATRLSQNLQNMGGIIGGLASFGSQAATALGAGGMVASLSAIVAVAAPVALAIGAVAAILGELQRRSQEAEQAAKQYSDELKRQADLAGSGRTTEEVQQEIAEDTTSRDFASSRLQSLTGARDALAGYEDALARVNDQLTVFFPSDEQFEPLRQQRQLYEELIAAQLTNASVIAGTQIPSIDALNAAIASGQGVVDEYTAAIDGNNALLAAGGTAQADAAEAARRSAEEHDAWARGLIQADQAVRSMSAEQIQARIQDLKDEDASVLRFYNTLSTEQQRAADLRMFELQAELSLLEQMLPAVQAAQNLANGIQDLTEFATEWVKLNAQFSRERERTRQDRSISADREEEDMLLQRRRRMEDFSRQMVQSELDFARDQQRRQEDFDRELAQMEAEVLERRADALEEFNLRERRAEEDHQIRLSDIIRDGRRAQMEAASRLDARAVFETQRRTRDQIRDEQRDFDLARKRRQEDFDRQVGDLEDNLEEQRRRRIEDFQRQQQEQAQNFAIQQQRRREDFQRQLQQEDADRALRLQRQQQDYALQDARRQEDFQRQIDNLVAHNTTLQNIQTVGQNSIQFAWQYFWNGMVATANEGATRSSRTVGNPGGRTLPTPFQTGTPYVPETGIYQLHAGEAVLRPDVAALYRTMLGNDFTQAQAASAVMGGGGRGANSVAIHWSGDVVLGDIGDRSDDQVIRLLDQGMRQFASQGLAHVQVAPA